MAELDEKNWIEISEGTKERLSAALEALIASLEKNKELFSDRKRNIYSAFKGPTTRDKQEHNHSCQAVT